MAFDFRQLTVPGFRPAAAIAELGTAHGGDLQKGLDLVDAAADSGAAAAKVQVVYAREILPPEAGMVHLPGGPAPLFQLFESLERPFEFYAALAARARARNIGFFGSAFGPAGVRLLEQIGVSAWKIASPELNHEPLLERLAATGDPIILSTGVSRQSDIQRAVDVIRAAAKSPVPSGSDAHRPNTPPLVLLHCLTCYPSPEHEANLRAIPAMAKTFGLPAGLSDHSLDPVLLPSLAVSLGAAAVEKHITLDRGGGGLDDTLALTPDDFARMTAAMRRFDGVGLEAAAESLAAEYGISRIEAALGDGSLEIAPSEKDHYGRTNRSLHAVGPLAEGTVITERNTAILRTEQNLRPGIPPRNRHAAYGRRLRRNVAPGDGIIWSDLAPDSA